MTTGTAAAEPCPDTHQQPRNQHQHHATGGITNNLIGLSHHVSQTASHQNEHNRPGDQANQERGPPSTVALWTRRHQRAGDAADTGDTS